MRKPCANYIKPCKTTTMLRIERRVYDELCTRERDETMQVSPLVYFEFSNVGRRIAYQSRDTVVLSEPGESLHVSFSHMWSYAMPMAPLTYHGLPVPDGQALINLARALYMECDPLQEPDSDTPQSSPRNNVDLWEYVAPLVNESVCAWICTHPIAFKELMEVEFIRMQDRVPLDRVYFHHDASIDDMMRANAPYAVALTNTYRFYVADRTYVDYCAWFESQPQLFAVEDEECRYNLNVSNQEASLDSDVLSSDEVVKGTIAV